MTFVQISRSHIGTQGHCHLQGHIAKNRDIYVKTEYGSLLYRAHGSPIP